MTSRSCASPKPGRAELQSPDDRATAGPMGEVNKLIVALKLHFFDVLSPGAARPMRDAGRSLREGADPPARPPPAPVWARSAPIRVAISSLARPRYQLEVEARRDWFRKLRASL